jgi:hypothetical protein
MRLQEKLDRLKENAIDRMPKEAVESIHRAVEDLKASGILDRTVKVGQKAPDFTLQNTENQAVSLSALIAQKPVVLSWYRGKW